MRVRFLGNMPATSFSGGRLLALTMAESLASAGADVEFLTDSDPEMYDEFRPFSNMKLTVADFANLSPWADSTVDVMVIVPCLRNVLEHGEWTRHAIECGARIVLVNFETPNWFNELSPVKRPAPWWKGWDIVSEYADLIMSISPQGDRYARQYYTNASDACLFDYCYTAINSVVADRAPQRAEPEKRIVFLTRVDKHKGFDLLAPLMCRDLAGYTVTLNFGEGRVPSRTLREWRGRFRNVGMDLEVRHRISSLDKFTLLKNSALLYFPTRFEGLGLPPLEAAYCGLPCACSDLPVLRELGGDAFAYGNPDDEADMRRAVLEALGARERVLQEQDRMTDIGRMDRCGLRLKALLEKLL
jgi:glycosyltransferase involved in cell wall biosynthesis